MPRLAGATGIGSLGVTGVVGVTGSAGCSGWTGVSGCGWLRRLRSRVSGRRLLGIDRNLGFGRDRTLAEVRPATSSHRKVTRWTPQVIVVVPSSFSSHSYSSAVRPGSSSITSCSPQRADDGVVAAVGAEHDPVRRGELRDVDRIVARNAIDGDGVEGQAGGKYRRSARCRLPTVPLTAAGCRCGSPRCCRVPR